MQFPLKKKRSQRKAETLMQRLYKGVCCYFSPRHKIKHPLMLYIEPHLVQRVHSQRDTHQHHPLHISSGQGALRGHWNVQTITASHTRARGVSFAKPLLGTRLNALSQSK